jgi:2-iminobutanoate/2-iminopropanoate deaminase
VASPYSPAVRAGDWIIVSGQLGMDPASGTIVEGVEDQARQALVNLAAVVGDAGATLADVAKTTVFVTDLGFFGGVNDVYAEAFGNHRPARSTLEVAALPLDAAVEIEAWVYAPQS